MGQSSTVLVTGATGFVGRHLVSALLAKGFKVRASGRNVEIARAMPWFDDVEFCTADIHAPDLDVGALTDGVEAIAHLARPGDRKSVVSGRSVSVRVDLGGRRSIKKKNKKKK